MLINEYKDRLRLASQLIIEWNLQSGIKVYDEVFDLIIKNSTPAKSTKNNNIIIQLLDYDNCNALLWYLSEFNDTKIKKNDFSTSKAKIEHTIEGDITNITVKVSTSNGNNTSGLTAKDIDVLSDMLSRDEILYKQQAVLAWLSIMTPFREKNIDCVMGHIRNYPYLSRRLFESIAKIARYTYEITVTILLLLSIRLLFDVSFTYIASMLWLHLSVVGSGYSAYKKNESNNKEIPVLGVSIATAISAIFTFFIYINNPNPRDVSLLLLLFLLLLLYSISLMFIYWKEARQFLSRFFVRIVSFRNKDITATGKGKIFTELMNQIVRDNPELFLDLIQWGRSRKWVTFFTMSVSSVPPSVISETLNLIRSRDTKNIIKHQLFFWLCSLTITDKPKKT